MAIVAGRILKMARTFTANEEEVMESFLKYGCIPKSDAGVSDYKGIILKLLRNEFIWNNGDRYCITERGKSAITQQIRSGHYWVISLQSYRRIHPKHQTIKHHAIKGGIGSGSICFCAKCRRRRGRR